MVGSALLVHPVTEAGATSVSVYFPGNAEKMTNAEKRLKPNSGLFHHFHSNDLIRQSSLD